MPVADVAWVLTAAGGSYDARGLGFSSFLMQDRCKKWRPVPGGLRRIHERAA